MEEKYFQASMHLQLQKTGRNQMDTQQIINSLAGHQEYEQIQALNVVGLDLNIMQNQALYAIQYLLSETNYKGNQLSYHSSSKEFGQIDHPVLQFSPADYYKAFGLNKHQTKSGYEQFLGGDCKQAMNALRSLYNRQFIISFDHKTFSNKKNQYVPGSVTIYAKLFGNIVEESQYDVNKKKSLKSITMVLSPIFNFQREKYNALAPVGYIQQIKKYDPRASKFAHHFVEYVLQQSHFGSNNSIRRKEETLAYLLRMDSFVKNRKGKEIRKAIQKSLEVAKAIEFITDYRYEQGYVEFTINREKLKAVDKKFK